MIGRVSVLSLLVAGAAVAQLSAPRIGCFVDANRRLRPVLGVAGVFLVGDPDPEEAMAAACLGDLTVIKKKVTIELRGRDFQVERPAPEGGALIAISESPAAALVYFTGTGEWFRLDRDSMVPAPPVEGAALSIFDPERPVAIVRRGEELWVDGAVSQPLPAGATEPVLLLKDAVLFCRGEELAMAGADGVERSWTLPGKAEALELLGRDWVRIRLGAGGGHLALSLDKGELYRLPEAGQ